MAAIDVYLQRVAYFREKLAIAIHVSGGQPARAPELLSIRHCNTDSGGRRNVFIEDGLVAFVSQYHKGFYASNDTKVIHRYLPRERLEAYVAKVRRSDGVEEIKSRRFMRPSSVFPNNTQQDVRAEASQEDDEEGINAEQWMGHIADL
ncbi:hypothetical protein N7467_006928 [Penicillium canescens]|nr:hypothetical protein N7467_006928 [Penicillium canescens]